MKQFPHELDQEKSSTLVSHGDVIVSCALVVLICFSVMVVLVDILV